MSPGIALNMALRAGRWRASAHRGRPALALLLRSIFQRLLPSKLAAGPPSLLGPLPELYTSYAVVVFFIYAGWPYVAYYFQ